MNDTSDTLLKLWFDTIGLNHSYVSFAHPSKVQKPATIVQKPIVVDVKKIDHIANVKPIKHSIIIHKALDLETDPADPFVQNARQLADKITTLDDLYATLKDFNGCSLKQTATNTVIFDGTSETDVMLIGEAPGSQEDEKGIPFCGDSGKLLDLILQSIGLSRKQNIYITNTIFWRPPANRRPTELEVAICRPFLEKHISLIKPKLLILVGSTALTALLGQEKQITKVRTQYYEYTNRYLPKPLTATAIFHPAYLLRQPMKKKDTWFDMLAIRKFLNSQQQ
jgi:uracil-DNA glycosylase family 4